MLKQYLECGMVINKRGIAGELKVECYCDSTSSVDGVRYLYTDAEGKNKIKVLSLKNYKGFLYIMLEGVDSAEKADLMRGKILYISRDDIVRDSGSHFIVDLIGLDVIDVDSGIIYGKISDVSNFGASDIYTVTNSKRTVMIPAVKDIVVKIDLKEGVYVRPIQGMFDEAEEIH